MNDLQLINSAVAFTDTYKKLADAHKAVREAMCTRTLYPAVLQDMREDDVYAGRLTPFMGSDMPIDFSTQKTNQGGYVMNWHALEQLAERNPARKEELDEIVRFWLRESSFIKYRGECEAADPVLGECILSKSRYDGWDKHCYLWGQQKCAPMGAGQVMNHIGNRLSGLMLDFDKLLRLGIPGLASEAEVGREKAAREGGDTGLFEGMLLSLETLSSICAYYEAQASALARSVSDPARAQSLAETARILGRLPAHAPETMREGIQLMWLYSIVARVVDYGRMDIYLGNFAARELDAGLLTEENAVRLLLPLWSMMDETLFKWNTRVVIGGRGRRNEANADRFALLAMEATRRSGRVMPVLTLRFYEGQNPALFSRALDVIGETGLYPTLYNDDVYIEGVRRVMDVPEEDARRYLPLGCGEIILDHASLGTPDSALNIPKALEAALHNGYDAADGACIGAQTGALNEFTTFDALLEAFKRQLRSAFEVDARVQVMRHESLKKDCAFLFQSLLLDDCVMRGRAMLDGGIRYLGGCVEGFGFTNAADSLTAIKKLVYDERRLSLVQLTAALDADFEGYEEERRLLLSMPKYGNNDPEADAMLREVASFLHTVSREIGKANGLDHYFVSSVNPGGITWGYYCGATADGRKKGEPFAVGDSPTASFDRSGVASMLASVAGSDAANGGYTTNLKLSREMFTRQRAKLEALLRVFFKNGGMQLNITVLSRGELECAMREPEKYSHVLVRVGGYSARFVELDSVMQREILARTLYGE